MPRFRLPTVAFLLLCTPGLAAATEPGASPGKTEGAAADKKVVELAKKARASA